MNPVASILLPGTASAQGFGPGAAAPEGDAATAFLEVFAAFMPQGAPPAGECPETSILPPPADETSPFSTTLSAAPAENEMPGSIPGCAPMQEMTTRATHLVIPAGAANIALPAATAIPETGSAAETAPGEEGADAENASEQPTTEGEAATTAGVAPSHPLPSTPAPDAAPQAPPVTVPVLAAQGSFPEIPATNGGADTGMAEGAASPVGNTSTTAAQPPMTPRQPGPRESVAPAETGADDCASPSADPAGKTARHDNGVPASFVKPRKSASPAIPSSRSVQANFSGSAPDGLSSAESRASASRSAVAAMNQAGTASRTAPPILVHSPAMQVAVQLHRAAENGPANIHMKLVPGELGTIDISLSIDEGRRVETTVIADHPQTLALLRRDAALLEKALDTAGLKPEQGGLHFSLRGDGENTQNQAFQHSQHTRHTRIPAPGDAAASTEMPAQAIYERPGALNITV